MVETPSDVLDVSSAVRELASMMLSHLSMAEVLSHAVEVAKRSVPGATEVSVTIENGSPVTAASTGQLAIEVDESQYTAGYGPCLDAIRLAETVVVEDQASDPRWPEYRPGAIEAGVSSSLSVPLSVDGALIGAFNIYSTRALAFRPASEAVAVAEELATYAAIVLSNAGLYFQATALAEQMQEAMRSRAVIEQAKGIVMGSRRCDAEEAFRVLVRLSQESGKKLSVVAGALVDQAVSASG